jgi:hypothetical protein
MYKTPLTLLVLYFTALPYQTLDQELSQAYQDARIAAAPAHAAVLRTDQRDWLSSVRNPCPDVACLQSVYRARIAALNQLHKPAKTGAVILGRCHMGVCWWWNIKSVELLHEESGKGALYKVRAQQGEKEYGEKYVDKNGYPKKPPNYIDWSSEGVEYVFCSRKLPLVINRGNGGKFEATVPIVSGAAEGVGNLFKHVCKFDISSSDFNEDENNFTYSLNKPLDAFKLIK